MDAYKFPHEVEEEVKDEIEVEIVDDVPAGDRNREALPQEIVDELEKDDLTEYSDKVKKRLGQMKRSGTMNAAPKKLQPAKRTKQSGSHSLTLMKINN